MNRTTNHLILPLDFPPELSSAAFVAHSEAAWPTSLAPKAVEWLGLHGYAVLGTELWLIKEGAIHPLPVGLSGMGEVHGNSVDREQGESWEMFVTRASALTAAFLRSFDPAQIVEQGELYFNVVWVEEEKFNKLGSGSV